MTCYRYCSCATSSTDTTINSRYHAVTTKGHHQDDVSLWAEHDINTGPQL